MHVGAQGDQPYSFYLKQRYNLTSKGGQIDLTDINVRDKNGCTPLHWAVFMGSPISISYLLANKDIDINAQDIWGQTPLHKAVKKNDLRVIKQLLVKGARRDIRDLSNLTPIDIAYELFSGHESTRGLLRGITDLLKEPSIFVEFAMIRLPSKQLSRNNKIVSLFLFLITLTFGLSAVMLNAINLRWVFYQVTALFAADLVFFMLTWSSSQSFINRSKNIDFVDLLETFDAESLCPFCEIIRMPRSRHCNICNRCVERYDHHCPWVNNCIGRANHLSFYLHLITLLLYTATVISASIYALF